MEGPKQHVILLPFMAQGHIIPFLALAQQIQRTYPHLTITLLNTPLNITYLRRSTAHLRHRINFASLPFTSSDHGLPPDTETTEGLPLPQIINLFHASTSLQPHFRRFISDLTAANHGCHPLCIISDIFMAWANDVAKSFGTVNLAFSTGGAYGTAAYMSLWLNLPHRNAVGDDEEFTVPGFPESYRFVPTQLHRFLRSADGTDPWSKFFQPQIAKSLESYGILCNTVEEIEPLGLRVLRNYTKIPVWCVGPLLPPEMLSSDPGIIPERTGKSPGVSPEKCIEWLDSHPKRSVLYISFGSQNTISPTQMMALAEGLEESKKPFIWVIRPPIGFDLSAELKPEWLPRDFEARTREFGLLVRKWAPQLEILRHGSTGAFVSHCGWNSVLESLSQGVPIIGWPLAAEQGYNAKMLVEEMGVCVELTRGVGSELGKERVKDMIRTVMDEDGINGKGEDMRKKAFGIRELMRDAVRVKGEEDGVGGSSIRAIDDLVSNLLGRKN